ncbi:hypothetical protein SCUP234_09442 [Seiridium cupressi]
MLRPRAAPLHLSTTSRSCLQNVASNQLKGRRSYVAQRLEMAQLDATTPLAKELQATRVWTTKHTHRKKADQALGEPPTPGDKTRVNIVSKELCDDVLSYIGKSLKRHKGCDLIDIYPGAGLWSSKLHDFLQPRSHILMEPDADLYTPFLEPLLKKKGTTLVPKSGIVWKDLNSVLNPQYLPKQKIVDRRSEQANMPNDTLLVTCNLSFHPRKRFVSFESLAMLLLHQFMDAVKTSSIFHKYGQVRMLVWTRREDKTNILPRLLQKRRRTALDGELLCDYIHEVVGWNGREYAQFARDTVIERASTVSALRKMKKAKIQVPQGRESDSLKQAMEDIKRRKLTQTPGEVPPMVERPFLETLQSLKASEPMPGTKDRKQLQEYQWRFNSDHKRAENQLEYMQRHAKLSALKTAGESSDEEIRAAEKELGDMLDRLPLAAKSEFSTVKDNLHLWRQEEPVLHWDRRLYEPLIALPEEFYPNVACCLLDIQPRPVHHLVRDIGAGSSRAGESFELILKAMWGEPKAPIDKALESVWPGASDWIIPRCPSLRDPAQGGININVKEMGLSVRTLNTKQWQELLEQWYQWPFRPEFQDLVARSQDYEEDESGLQARLRGIDL